MNKTEAAFKSPFPSDPHYLIIGNGKVAQHFQQYFRILEVPHSSWSRKSDTAGELNDLAHKADIILVLISDPAIVPFLEQNPELQKKICVHFSGTLSTPLAWGAHPLNTFSKGHYSLETYEQTYFVCEDSGRQFQDVFPRLKNRHASINKEHKPLYHALCVLTGNFTTLLWQKGFRDFSEKLALDPAALVPYLKTTMNNLIANPETALTGPLARRDLSTIQRHLSVLEGDAFAPVYEAFVRTQGLEVKP